MHGGELCKNNSIEVLGKFPGVMPDAPFDVIKDAVMVFAASLGRAKVASLLEQMRLPDAAKEVLRALQEFCRK